MTAFLDSSSLKLRVSGCKLKAEGLNDCQTRPQTVRASRWPESRESIRPENPPCPGDVDDPAGKARTAGEGIITVTPVPALACFVSLLPLDLPYNYCVIMPSTVIRDPVRKALSIGIEYRELGEKLPQFRLSGTHKDPLVLSHLLQGGSCEYW